MHNPNQDAFADFDHMVDELSFRQAVTQIALLPDNVMDLIVAQNVSITPEMDSQRWN